jgi:hypothetical protein
MVYDFLYFNVGIFHDFMFLHVSKRQEYEAIYGVLSSSILQYNKKLCPSMKKLHRTK